jgi:hypothetical protein
MLFMKENMLFNKRKVVFIKSTLLFMKRNMLFKKRKVVFMKNK